MPETGNERLETMLDFFLTRRRKGRHRPPVKRVGRGDDFVAAGCMAKFPREFDQPFIGLRAAVAKNILPGPVRPTSRCASFACHGL